MHLPTSEKAKPKAVEVKVVVTAFAEKRAADQ
jgi:hypothetical protein